MDIIAVLSQELSVPKTQIESAVKLMDEGNTIPFIARYRKEVTGGLDDTILEIWRNASIICAIWKKGSRRFWN